MSVIFLAGVHGVGKGYLGSSVAKSLRIAHYTASQLIRQEKGLATWDSTKMVADVDDNQLALIRAVERCVRSEPDILLDGHFVLRSAAGGLARLSTNVFSSLNLSGVILLSDDAEVISSRLLSRDGVLTSPQAIADLAVEEALHANAVCRFLKVPLVLIESPNEAMLTDSVSRFLQTREGYFIE
jgi:adenylate kinase